ncbi:MAG: exosortase A [Pseudomonadota bacterium]
MDSAADSLHRAALVGGGVLLVLLGVLYFPSLQTMWHTWGDSNTYQHGFIVFPMSAYLIYTQWSRFAAAPQQPVLLGALVLIGCGLLWIVAELLNVHVIGQLMFVSMILVLAASYFGLSKVATLLFPLAYLYFAVPMGESLVPVLMDFTADFTIWALKATGLPVYRDGMFFSIPAGDFEVAKACSGIRYLMASFALGTLYAYLSFRSFRKQLVFSIISLIVPIIANGIRAYGIVMIAHFSDMRYAVGVDHLVYGWMFFGFVMLLLFYIGGRFRSADDLAPQGEKPVMSPHFINGKQLITAVLVLGVALVIPHGLGVYARSTNAATALPVALPKAGSAWRGPETVTTSFAPDFSGAIASTRGRFEPQRGARADAGYQPVFVWVFRYPAFSAEHEMVTATNVLADLDRWAVFDQRARETDVHAVIETNLGDRFDEYTIWHWYQLNEQTKSGLVQAKLAEAVSLLTGSINLDQALVVLATPERGVAAEQRLGDFLATHAAALKRCAIEMGNECERGEVND